MDDSNKEITDSEYFGSWPWGANLRHLTDDCIIASVRYAMASDLSPDRSPEVRKLMNEAKRRPALVPQMVVLKLKGLIP